jgi:hypothetical protein
MREGQIKGVNAHSRENEGVAAVAGPQSKMILSASNSEICK